MTRLDRDERQKADKNLTIAANRKRETSMALLFARTIVNLEPTSVARRIRRLS
jgi:hypothetical protein